MPDSIYDRQTAGVRRSYADTMAYLQKQRSSAQQSFGFDDASNPYSQAKLLERAYQQRSRGTSTSFAASGGLYSGALQRAQGENRFSYDQSVDSARRQYQELLDSLGYQEAQAGSAQESGLLGAEESSLARQQATTPVDPGVPPPAASAPAGGGKTKLPQAEYLRRLRAIRDRHGAGSREVKNFRARNSY